MKIWLIPATGDSSVDVRAIRPDSSPAFPGSPSTSGLFVFICVFTILMVTGCAEEAPEQFFDEDYVNWARTVTEPLTYPIPGHGERRRAIFINNIGTTVEPVTDDEGRVSYDYPDGTIVLKENYTDVEGSELANFTIMIKASKDDRSRDGWIWVNRDAQSGKETLFTESTFCLTCHVGANKEHPYGDGNRNNEFRDFLFFPYLAGE